MAFQAAQNTAKITVLYTNSAGEGGIVNPTGGGEDQAVLASAGHDGQWGNVIPGGVVFEPS